MNYYELWVEGTNLWGHQVLKARFIDNISGTDFDDAVDRYVETLPPKQAACWEYEDGNWQWTGRRAFDNKSEAMAVYG